ncbi:MAG: hypothetical protein NPINA01_19970 [Nitrospinaceae bacterium]|nr:MAG: hypothetical protein NPINA01_19970 [Nitrospinaceae bacterium]
MMSLHRIPCIGLIVFFITAVVVNASQASSKLGTVDFPTSISNKKVQEHFLRGVAALHSFWYEEALEAFQQSTQVDPDFVMGYWGEAMAHNKPLWERQDTQAGKAALAKIQDTQNVTDRERAFVDAVRLLYGEGDKLLRDQAYSDAMQKIYRKYSEDLEAACFYALSLLGVSRNSDHKLRLQVEAGAIGLEVFRKSPDHPCAAHYTIHAFDHPDLAILGLPAARRYAKIAPESHHAQHMPAHIFVQLGMWPEAAASNEAGWQTSVDWVKRSGLPRGKRDYHSLQWLHYAYLQQGRYQKADAIFKLKLEDMRAAGGGDADSKTNRRTGKYYERMAGASVFERERWELAEALAEPSGWNLKGHFQASLLFIRGFATAMLGKGDAASHLKNLQAIRSQGIKGNFFERPEQLDIWALEIRAVMAASKKDYQNAIDLMKKATAIEEALPAPSGPPRIIKPTFELSGEILLRAGKPKDAQLQFATSLLRHPNRARSLLGAARSAAGSGDRPQAVRHYSKFLTIWAEADPALPELAEAREYLQKRP